jgi:hypothetical protein
MFVADRFVRPELNEAIQVIPPSRNTGKAYEAIIGYVVNKFEALLNLLSREK